MATDQRNQRNLNAKASITVIKVENDRRESVRKLTQALDVTAKMVHTTPHKELKLFWRMARRVPNLSDKEIKKE